MLENSPVCVKKGTRYCVSVTALSSVAVKGEILKFSNPILLSPNSCIFEVTTLKYTNFYSLFSASRRYVGAPGQAP